jgi:hypothetical protein
MSFARVYRKLGGDVQVKGCRDFTPSPRIWLKQSFLQMLRWGVFMCVFHAVFTIFI